MFWVSVSQKRLWELLVSVLLELLPAPVAGRLVFAHSDWAGYSVLEEAFTRGHHAGLWAAQLS